LHDAKGPARATLVRALWRFVPADAPVVRDLLDDADWATRLETALCVASADADRSPAIPVLLEALHREAEAKPGEGKPSPSDEATRREVRRAIERIGDPVATSLAKEIDGLRAALRQADEDRAGSKTA